MINIDLMAKKLLIITLLAITAAFAIPTSSKANAMVEIIDYETQEVSITVKASTVHVTGANGQMLYVYNVAGVRVMSLRIDGNDRQYDLDLPKGCYIIQVGKTSRKVSIK